jgi:hypothetical protein
MARVKPHAQAFDTAAYADAKVIGYSKFKHLASLAVILTVL